MKFLRTVSTRRLLAVLAGVVVVAVGGTAIAVAASNSGPVPKPASLADAIHQGLSGPKVDGITAQITFSNHLIDASNLQGSDPLLNGATGRLWFSPSQHRLRLELQSTNGDSEVVVDQHSFWISDPRSHTVYEGTLPAMLGGTDTTDRPGWYAYPTDGSGGHGAYTYSPQAKTEQIPSVAQIQTELNKLAEHLNIYGTTPGDNAALPSDYAGRPTYTVRVTPKHDGGLLGAALLAWDAVRGVPLDFAVYANHGTTPVLELQANNISYGAVPASDFTISPPAGDTVVKLSTAMNARAGQADHKPVTGLSAVAQQLPFSLTAPTTLVGLPRRTVAKLGFGGSPAAVVTYGQGIGGIAVIEHQQSTGTPARAPASSHSDSRSALSLPTVSVGGVSAHELDTALGTVLTFTVGKLAYTVIGSVPPAAAEAAATAIVKAP